MKSELKQLIFNIELQPGERLSLPQAMIESVGEGRWTITVKPTVDEDQATRDHSAFLGSYAPEDEGLYDDGRAYQDLLSANH